MLTLLQPNRCTYRTVKLNANKIPHLDRQTSWTRFVDLSRVTRLNEVVYALDCIVRNEGWFKLAIGVECRF